jgi:D-glycero-D-manno-heptose 1,7-bisphosphate phosphatase
MLKKTKLIILDRDGVINQDSDAYIKSPDEWIPIASSLKAIAKLNALGYCIGVATNQSGIGRGFFNTQTLNLIHEKMHLSLKKVGGHIDRLEYCPDHPDQATHNRKPNTGMLESLLHYYNVYASNTWFVGDSVSDIKCAINAGCRPVLVLTGKGMQAKKILLQKKTISSILTFKNLNYFVLWLQKTNSFSNGLKNKIDE